MPRMMVLICPGDLQKVDVRVQEYCIMIIDFEKIDGAKLDENQRNIASAYGSKQFLMIGMR